MRLSPIKRWLFRLAAIGCGLVPLLAAELALRGMGWGERDHQADPFAGFQGTSRLFVPSDDGQRLEIPLSRQGFFRPDSFLATKPENDFRVFVLGGSTVQGRPFAIETSFTTWLEIALRAADPSRTWEIVNCGGVSYASYRLVPILEEVLDYGPDLIIVYTGHNEFLEDRTYGHIKSRPELVNRLLGWAGDIRLYGALRQAYSRLQGEAAASLPAARPVLPEEVDALLDYQGGIEFYHYDAKWRHDVQNHFQHNLRRMVELARQAEVPLWFVDPVFRLRDCPPFKAANLPELPTTDRAEWDRLRAAAAHAARVNPLQAIDLYREALQIDAAHAGLHYELAECLDRGGKHDEAEDAYRLAKDYDLCPLRILDSMLTDLHGISEATKTPLIGVRPWFERHSADGILGGGWLIDHVHPTVEGHQKIADLLAAEFAARGWIRPPPDWETRRRAAYDAHLESLSDFYFQKGMERLRGLRDWAAGRAQRLRTTGTAPPGETE